jgi:hypothetical protein
MALLVRRSVGIGGLVFLVAVAGTVYATLSHSNPVTVIGARQPAGIDFSQDQEANLAAGNSSGQLALDMSVQPGYAGYRIVPYGIEVDVVGKPTAAERAIVVRDAPQYRGKDIPIRFRSVRYSEKELQALTQRISDDFGYWQQQGIRLTGWGPEIVSNTVQIDLAHYTPGYRDALRARYGDRVSVVTHDVQPTPQ